jgi:hypothetical protein
MMKWNAGTFIAQTHEKIQESLEAVGHLMINEMASQAHKVSGTLANSMNYKIKNNANTKKSGFSSKYSTGVGDSIPPTSAEVSLPDTNLTVRAGSNLVYAGPQEKLNNWATNSMDALRKRKKIQEVLSEAMRGR